MRTRMDRRIAADHEVAHGPAEPHASTRTAQAAITRTTTAAAVTATGRGTGRTNRRRPMTFPLMALAVGAIVAGFVGIPAALGGGNAIEHFLEPSFVASSAHHEPPQRRRPTTRRSRPRPSTGEKEPPRTRHARSSSA